MTKKTIATITPAIDHRAFGGVIYPSDFYTNYRSNNNTKGSCIAGRIAKDFQFDAQCRKQCEKLTVTQPLIHLPNCSR